MHCETDAGAASDPQCGAQMWQHANTTALRFGLSILKITCKVQPPPCAHFPLTAGVPCPNLREEGSLPVAKTTADLYKLIRVGGIVLRRECSWLGLRSPPYSSARPTLNYNADKMPSQLKHNEPSDVSKSTLHTEN